MDARPTPRPAARLVVEVNRASDGRLEGRLRIQDTGRWRPFSGVLELLKALEETLDAVDCATQAPAKEATDS
jgi:hypothetical protein